MRKLGIDGAAACVCAALAAAGCTSNRFQLANDARVDRERELLTLDQAGRPAAQGPALVVDALPPGPALAQGHAPWPDRDPTLIADPALQPPAGAPALPPARTPAISYPPPGDSQVGWAGDPDADVLRAERQRDIARGAGRTPERDPARPLPATPPGGYAGAPSVEQPGRPTGPHVQGQVLDSLGQPAAAASVQALDVARGRQIAAEVATDAEGRFRVWNLDPGATYELVAAAERNGAAYAGRATAVPPQSGVAIRLAPTADRRAPAPLPNAPRNPDASPFAPQDAGVPQGDVRVTAPRMLPVAPRAAAPPSDRGAGRP